MGRSIETGRKPLLQPNPDYIHELIEIINASSFPMHMSMRLSSIDLDQAAAVCDRLAPEHLQVLADKLYEKVTELENANERLRNLSLTDGITGLNNRRGFMILATGLLKFARRVGYSLSLLYIDLDSLKLTNDTLGHTAGDALIVRFSNILLDTFRDSDIIGRLGGDEFVVLMADATESDVESMRAHLQKNVDAHNLQTDLPPIAFSLGVIRVFPDTGVTMEELLSRADRAMYEHKMRRRRPA